MFTVLYQHKIIKYIGLVEAVAIATILSIKFRLLLIIVRINGGGVFHINK